MVSVMPPSGVGGLPGFNPGHHDISLASRYNHLAVMQDTQASYYQFAGVASAQEQMAQTRSMPAPIARKIMEPTRGRSRGKTMPQSIGKTMPQPQSIGKRMPQEMAAPITVTSANDLSAVNSKPKICDRPGCKGIHDHQNQNKGSKRIAMDQPSIGDGGPPRVRNTTSNQTAGPGSKPPADLSSLSKSLFVDCSVEYELPMVPKIPPDSQPLLVIHPGWQQKRRITRSSSQQRLIYEEQQRMALQQHQHQYLQYMSSLSGNAVCSQCPPANAPGNHAAPQSQTQPTQASATAVMQPPRPVPNPNIVATSTATATTASSVTSRKRSYQATNLPQIMPPPQQQNQMCYSGFAATATGADGRRPHQRPAAEFTESQESNTSKRARLSSASAQQVSASRAAAAQHQAQHAHAAAASHPSWGIPFPCHERSCIEMQHRQMALMHQHHQHQQQQQQAQQAEQQRHQQHQYMLRNHQQQQWQQQLLRNRDDAGACPLPLPAPPPPVSGSNPAVVAGSNPPGGNRLAAPQTGAHSTGFFHHQMHHAHHPGSHHQYHPPHNWHPAYFCPPSAVQLQRQQHQQHQQWLQQQQHYKQQQQQHAQHAQQQQQQIQSMQNNNCLQPKQPCCSKCVEGKCNMQATPSTVMFQQQQQQRRNVVANSNAVTHVHYRSV